MEGMAMGAKLTVSVQLVYATICHQILPPVTAIRMSSLAKLESEKGIQSSSCNPSFPVCSVSDN